MSVVVAVLLSGVGIVFAAVMGYSFGRVDREAEREARVSPAAPPERPDVFEIGQPVLVRMSKDNVWVEGVLLGFRSSDGANTAAVRLKMAERPVANVVTDWDAPLDRIRRVGRTRVEIDEDAGYRENARKERTLS